MKIGITCYPSIGGSGILATELGKKLAERGHEVHFITSAMPVRLGGDGYAGKIFFHEAEPWNYPVFKDPPYCLALAAKMAEIGRQVPLDLIHVHYAIPHAGSSFIARSMMAEQGIKTITTLHGTDVTLVGSQPGFIPLTGFLIDQSDGVTAVSEHLKNVTYEIFKVKKDIEVIYNFVDTKQFKPVRDMEMRRRFAPDDHKILIHMSNFRPVKKVLNTIRVFDMVRKYVPATLLMLGDGVEYYPATRLVDSMGLTEHVKFLGNQNDVEKILPIADLFIINSIKESFGLAVLEAAACGVPSVVTDIGGLPEVVVDGETGYISPADNIEHMAARAVEILTDNEMRREMSDKARDRAVREFDADLVVPRYEEYYQRVLGPAKLCVCR